MDRAHYMTFFYDMAEAIIKNRRGNPLDISRSEIELAVNGWLRMTANNAHVLEIGGGIAALNVFRSGNISRILAVLAEFICSVGASEASAERSFSRVKHMRDGRFHLSADKTEIELIVAFNPRPIEIDENEARIARRSDAGKKRPRSDTVIIDDSDAGSDAESDADEGSDEDGEEIETQEDDADASLKDTSAAYVASLDESDKQYMIDPSQTPFLSSKQCRVVFSVCMFMTSVWPELDAATQPAASATNRSESEADALRRSGKWVHWGGSGWIPTTLMSLDRSKLQAKVTYTNQSTSDGKVTEHWGLFDCWSKCLQPASSVDHATGQITQHAPQLWWDEARFLRSLGR